MTRDILIFDLDGTLIDSMAPLETLFCEMLATRCGVEAELSRPIFHELLGAGPRLQFEAVLQRRGRFDAALLGQITADYWQIAETFEPASFPETLDVRSDLHRGGHTLIVSSGGTTASVRRKVRLARIDGFFRLTLGSDEGVARMAKGPGHLALIREALALDEASLQRRGVLIGDAAYDMRVGHAAGLPAVGRVTGANASALRDAGAKHLIADLREIQALLQVL